MKLLHKIISAFSVKKMIKSPVLYVVSTSSYTTLFLILFVSFLGIVYSIEDVFDKGFANEFAFITSTILGILPKAFLVVLFFIAYPIMITVTQAALTIKSVKSPEIMQKTRILDAITIPYGIFCSIALMAFIGDVDFSADWHVQLSNSSVHTPLWTKCQPTFFILVALGIAGYLLLEFIDVRKLPPLILVVAMASMYICTIMGCFWLIQVYDKSLQWVALGLVPLNFTLIAVRVITCTVKILQQETCKKIYNNKFMSYIGKLLDKSVLLPVYAIIMIIPLLGFIIAVLMLFGQQPDSMIQVFTQTSEWTLSQQVSPENIQTGHYLCTVAAGGHKRLVKPQRVGIRHGHKIIVNRQLCIANAFEQVIEEKTPRFHKALRSFYDKYGLPISMLIRTKFAADIVYIIMKPLEWIFLAVLYLTDVNPENRIAIQYTGKVLNDFEK